MTIHVTALQVFVCGLLIGALVGAMIASYIFWTKVSRLASRCLESFRQTTMAFSERFPRLLHDINQLGLTVALARHTTEVANELTRGVAGKIRARAARRPIGFRSEASRQEGADGR